MRGRGRHNGHRHACGDGCAKGCTAAKQRTGRLKNLFNLTDADYATILAHQGGACGICGRPPRTMRLNVDHRHDDGLIRGLLCFWCNKALAKFRDSTELLRSAILYLERPPATAALGEERYGRPGRVTNKARKTKHARRG